MAERTVSLAVPPSRALPVLGGRPELAAKRTLDLVGGLVAALALLPILMIIAAAIRLDSRGPAIYVATRLGKGGQPFRCVKFRTMQVGADAMRQQLIGTPDDSICERYRSDPRVTRVGRLLRRWSLDELPQVLNIITGSMSMVGPRPILPEEWCLLRTCDLPRHDVKPGLTGLWQVSGRKDVMWEDRMRLDVEYARDWSLGRDLVIIMRTVRVVLSGRGAY